jgi:hypothetical protein
LNAKCIDSDGNFDEEEEGDDKTDDGEYLEPDRVFPRTTARIAQKGINEISKYAYSIYRNLEGEHKMV